MGSCYRGIVAIEAIEVIEAIGGKLQIKQAGTPAHPDKFFFSPRRVRMYPMPSVLFDSSRFRVVFEIDSVRTAAKVLLFFRFCKLF